MTAVALSTPERGPDRRAVEAFLLEAVARAARERRLTTIRVPAPAAPLESLSLALRKDTCVSWRPPSGLRVAGHGATALLRLAGEDRFAALAPRARALFEALSVVTHPSVRPRAARLFGGWSFAEGGADAGPWEGFGDGCFVLPRWSYEEAGDEAALRLSVDGRSARPTLVEAMRAELSTVWEALSQPPPLPRGPTILRVDHADSEAFTRAVRAITDAIARGEAQKIVLARRSAAFASHGIEPAAVTRALAARYPDTHGFALRLGGATFVGASPERLFTKRGAAIEADALAGSIAADAEDAEARLAASAKDLREHRPVVEHLAARLRPLCRTLDAERPPRIRRLPNVLHLHTTVQGTLTTQADAAQLAAALHPTPAVGGVPGPAARAWIARHEPVARGWYAGPIGWLDADGDADFAVALRCALLFGSTAWLYAGAGIVEGSEAATEWRETSVKLRPMLGALGAS